MFEPDKLPAPDANGFFCHPDVPGEDESDNIQELCQRLGFAVHFVRMESDAPEYLTDAYFNGDDLSAPARWIPTPPVGKDWRLVAKYDTEDGPYAMFVHPWPIVIEGWGPENPDNTVYLYPSTHTTRSEVYAVINEERDYQDRKWGAGSSHSVQEWIDIMQRCLFKAGQAHRVCDSAMLDEVRQVVAVGVACMEQHGAVHRNPLAKQSVG